MEYSMPRISQTALRKLSGLPLWGTWFIFIDRCFLSLVYITSEWMSLISSLPSLKLFRVYHWTWKIIQYFLSCRIRLESFPLFIMLLQISLYFLSLPVRPSAWVVIFLCSILLSSSAWMVLVLQVFFFFKCHVLRNVFLDHPYLE